MLWLVSMHEVFKNRINNISKIHGIKTICIELKYSKIETHSKYLWIFVLYTQTNAWSENLTIETLKDIYEFEYFEFVIDKIGKAINIVNWWNILFNFVMLLYFII